MRRSEIRLVRSWDCHVLYITDPVCCLAWLSPPFFVFPGAKTAGTNPMSPLEPGPWHWPIYRWLTCPILDSLNLERGYTFYRLEGVTIGASDELRFRNRLDSRPAKNKARSAQIWQSLFRATMRRLRPVDEDKTSRGTPTARPEIRASDLRVQPMRAAQGAKRRVARRGMRVGVERPAG
jgi:hypothetical protein